MVMHARKTQRMSDGYFEKHQTHPYQNSKYAASKGYGSNSERYEKFRDSPNGTYRSDSPESQSPRDRERSYQSKSYLQKMREKERENRDYKMSRDKYSELARSPKDKRSRDSDHRTNSDRGGDDKSILHPLKVGQLSSRERKPMHNNCVDKRDDRDRVQKVGDWSEHVSSSGKKYYYNCKTEVSQWEKPREWMDRERERDRFRGRDRERDDRYRNSSSRPSMRHDKHSNSRGSNGSGSSKETSRHWNSREAPEGSTKESSSDWPSSSRRHSNPDNSVQSASSATQDMDISPGDSTPTSEVSYGATSAHQTPLVVEQPVMGPVLLANALPRLSSHPTTTSSSTPTLVTTPSLLSTPGLLSAAPTNLNSPPQGLLGCGQQGGPNAPGPPLGGNQARLLPGESDSKKSEPLTVDTSQSVMGGDGPPTPTHSEVPDCSKVQVPSGSPPTGGLPPMQGVSSSLQALRPQGPTITPSLANHYRDDLVNHVRNWSADILEKQVSAQKLAEEAHIMGSIQCSKVSAELKSARSIVRLTEIQATLQEQRILFLRQQIKELEELKSQNSFMSDDP